MRLLAQSHVATTLAAPTELMLMIEAARAPGQAIVEEALTTTPDPGLIASETDGIRLRRGVAEGPIEFAYRALIDVDPRRPVTPELVQQRWSDLPSAVLPYLLSSRFCPADKFMRFAAREFGDLAGGAKLLAILDWLRRNVDYVHGVSDAETTAERTFVDRAGVCRDFAHLAITLARAGGLPARAVAAYALDLQPPDFHAVAEVWLGGGWWLFDPTGLAPVDGLIRIAHGRDAADIAFLTTGGATGPLTMTVSVARMD
jgi:transglutaminase-like putative cysteine protease